VPWSFVVIFNKTNTIKIKPGLLMNNLMELRIKYKRVLIYNFCLNFILYPPYCGISLRCLSITFDINIT